MQSIDDSHPLLLHNLAAKAAYSPADYLGATVRTIDGYGSKGAKPRPFNQHAAVRQFGSWVYKARCSTPTRWRGSRCGCTSSGESDGHEALSHVARGQKRALTGAAKRRAPAEPLRVAMKVAEWDGDFEEVTEPHPALRLLNKRQPVDERLPPRAGADDLPAAHRQRLHAQGAGPGPERPEPALADAVAEHVEIKPSKTNFIDGYVYGTGRENEKTFLPDEVIHNKLPNPKQPYYGMGCVEAAWTALGLHASKRVMDQAKFDNMNRPDWFIAFKAGVKPEALERLEARIDEKFKGPSKSGKFLALGAKATIQALNQELRRSATPTASSRRSPPASASRCRCSRRPTRTAPARRPPTPRGSATPSARWRWRRGDAQRSNCCPRLRRRRRRVPRLRPGQLRRRDDDPPQRRGGRDVGGMLNVNEAREEIGYQPDRCGGDMLVTPRPAPPKRACPGIVPARQRRRDAERHPSADAAERRCPMGNPRSVERGPRRPITFAASPRVESLRAIAAATGGGNVRDWRELHPRAGALPRMDLAAAGEDRGRRRKRPPMSKLTKAFSAVIRVAGERAVIRGHQHRRRRPRRATS
jgi:hypothetical protein